MSLFSFITDINGFLEIPTPSPVSFDPPPPFIEFNKNLRLPVYSDPSPSPLLIRHLRVACLSQEKLSELLKNQQVIQTMKITLPGIYWRILRDQDRSKSCL